VPPLACTVRGCGEPLQREARSYVCPRGHTYDIARAGYVNLLQPQDRKSTEAGDTRERVEARARLLARRFGRSTIETIVERALALTIGRHDLAAADLGCGSGELLGLLSQRQPALTGIGIDLSTAAATHAARSFPRLTWVVANADRILPLRDHSAALVFSVHGRRNPVECRRVLADDGFLIVATPAADDLIEVRAALQGTGIHRDRTTSLIAEHATDFAVKDRFDVRQRQPLDADAVMQVLKGTYRGERTREAARAPALGALTVTFASDVVVFAPR
jgi:23S rRNA (guanine745-N1)-methyltransferase